MGSSSSSSSTCSSSSCSKHTKLPNDLLGFYTLKVSCLISEDDHLPRYAFLITAIAAPADSIKFEMVSKHADVNNLNVIPVYTLAMSIPNSPFTSAYIQVDDQETFYELGSRFSELQANKDESHEYKPLLEGLITYLYENNLNLEIKRLPVEFGFGVFQPLDYFHYTDLTYPLEFNQSTSELELAVRVSHVGIVEYIVGDINGRLKGYEDNQENNFEVVILLESRNFILRFLKKLEAYKVRTLKQNQSEDNMGGPKKREVGVFIKEKIFWEILVIAISIVLIMLASLGILIYLKRKLKVKSKQKKSENISN